MRIVSAAWLVAALGLGLTGTMVSSGCSDSEEEGGSSSSSSGGSSGTANTDGGTISQATTLAITEASADLVVGATYPMRALWTDDTGAARTGFNFTWKTSDAAVAIVNETSGVVTAVGPGTATITVTSSTKSATATVTVNEAITDGMVFDGGNGLCVLTRAGDAYCWDLLATGVNEPSLVPGGHKFVTISSGSYTTIGLTADGTAWAWGRNVHGKFGDGTKAAALDLVATPVPVSGGLKFKSVSVGFGHVLALTASGKAYAWGRNNDFALGDNTQTERLTPVEVLGGLTFVKVSAGNGYSLGLTASGIVYHWGREQTDGTSAAMPTELPGGVTNVADVMTSVSYPNFRALRTNDGKVYTWGANTGGQLGNDQLTDDRSATPVEVSGGRTYKSISVGHAHIVAIGADGKSYGWGSREDGQLGGPKQLGAWYGVPTLLPPSPPFSSLVAGEYLSAAVSDSGVVYGWGFGVLPYNGPWRGPGLPTAPVRITFHAPSTISVTKGQSAKVAVTFDWASAGAFSIYGPAPLSALVTVKVTGKGGAPLPNGVTVKPVIIQQGQAAGEIEIAVSSASSATKVELEIGKNAADDPANLVADPVSAELTVNGGSPGSSTSSGGSGKCAGPYNGPTKDVQSASFCQAAWNYCQAGNITAAEQNCAIFQQLDNDNGGNLEDCPYCPPQ